MLDRLVQRRARNQEFVQGEVQEVEGFAELAELGDDARGKDAVMEVDRDFLLLLEELPMVDLENLKGGLARLVIGPEAEPGKRSLRLCVQDLPVAIVRLCVTSDLMQEFVVNADAGRRQRMFGRRKLP